MIECVPPCYCPNKGSSSQSICPVGFYRDTRAMCTPKQCPRGSFVSCPGKIFCSNCSAYCPNSMTQILCPSRGYCARASVSPIPCPQLSAILLVCMSHSLAPPVSSAHCNRLPFGKLLSRNFLPSDSVPSKRSCRNEHLLAGPCYLRPVTLAGLKNTCVVDYE